MPSDKPLSPEERFKLVQTLTELPDAQFKMLTFALGPPAGILPSDLAALGDRAFALLQWVESDRGPKIPALLKLLDRFLDKPLFPGRVNNLSLEDWEELFRHFRPHDFPKIYDAVLWAVKQDFKRDFEDIYRGQSAFTDADQIQRFLADHDKPLLTARFVEKAIALIEQSEGEVTASSLSLKQWLQSFVERFNVPPAEPEEPSARSRQGYLLVAFVANEPLFSLFPELRVDGQEESINFGASTVSCTLSDVPKHLSNWMRRAEEKLVNYQCGQMMLELFLPCRHIESITDLAETWEVQNPQGDARPFKYRDFVIRSLERVLARSSQITLQANWGLLEACTKAKDAHVKFHPCEDCPDVGELETLRDVPGLKLVANLPEDVNQRWKILTDIANAAIPIAFWFGLENRQTAAERLTELDTFLRNEPYITNFARLAQRWRTKRAGAHMRLLCDHPERWPSIPDPDREDDLLVAS